jgi:hypothetical protein
MASSIQMFYSTEEVGSAGVLSAAAGDVVFACSCAAAGCERIHLLGDAISLHAKRSPFRYSSFSRCGIGPRSIAAFMRAHASSKPSI